MPGNQNILQFWRNVELFRPFSLGEIYNRYSNIIEIKLSDTVPPPWIDVVPYELDADYYYGFDLFLGIFSLDETKVLCDQLLPLSRQHIYQEDRAFEGLSAVLRVAIDPRGEGVTVSATLLEQNQNEFPPQNWIYVGFACSGCGISFRHAANRLEDWRG